MECDDGSEISSRVYCGREDGVMGSLAAGGVAEGDWAELLVSRRRLFITSWRRTAEFGRRPASLAVGIDV